MRLAAGGWLAWAAAAGLVASAQSPQSATEVGVSDGTRTYTVARLVAGRLETASPCVPTDAPLDALALTRVARAPRFLDWLFASDAGGRATYYFEVSRRVPSATAPLDVDVDTDPPGTVRVVVSGFVRPGASGLSALATKGEPRWARGVWTSA